MTQYVIRGGEAGTKRLGVLGRTLWPTTSELLRRAGLEAGMACLDLGCGSGDVTLEMAALAGPGGRVTGLDMDEAKLDFARETARDRGLENAVFRSADVVRWAEEGLEEPNGYDLVYCRFLLTHLREPAPVLRQMWRSLRAGGRAVLEDVDFAGHFCHPACPAFDRYVELYRAVVARRGGDADIGPRLYFQAREAGWQSLELRVVQPAFVAGEGKTIALITLVNTADAILAEGLASEEQLRATIEELEAFTASPDTLVGMPRIFQVWGSAGDSQS